MNCGLGRPDVFRSEPTDICDTELRLVAEHLDADEKKKELKDERCLTEESPGSAVSVLM